ncbi:hypothetical protein ACRAWF_32700 [Streptomyces sp. L7]
MIGVDNDKLAPFAMPPLTTIDNNLDVVVGRAARMIVSGVTGRALPSSPQVTPVSLVVASRPDSGRHHNARLDNSRSGFGRALTRRFG